MLFRNTLAQSASVFAGYLFSFVLAPIMIARLGLEAFGIWAVTGALATYAGLLDLGISRSVSRFIATYDAVGDERRIRECVGLGLVAVAIVAVLAAGVAAALAPLLSDRLGVLSTSEMRIVLLAAVGIWTFNGFDGVLGAVGIGKRRMVPPNVANTVGVTLNFAFSIVALAISSSLVVYAVANAAAALVGIVPMAFALRYLWQAPYVAVPSRGLVKEVLSYSLKNQVGWLADLVNMETDKVVIAMLVGVRAVATYEIASRVVHAVRGAAVLTVSAMVTTAAAEIVTEGRQVVAELYRRYTLRSSAIAFPLLVLAAVAAPFLLIGWLGTAPGDAALLLPVLTIPYLLNLTTGGGSTIALGAGYPGLVSANSVLIAVVNVALTLALAPFFGLWGVVAATVVAISLGSLIFTARFLRLFDLPVRDFLAGVIQPGLLAVGLALPVGAVTLSVGVPDDRVTAIGWLAVVTIAYGAPYWILASRRELLPEKLRLPLRRRRAKADVA
ncbi:MAG: oligosaccharide flippase family protein [Thermoleophilaceae bacterium]